MHEYSPRLFGNRFKNKREKERSDYALKNHKSNVELKYLGFLSAMGEVIAIQCCQPQVDIVQLEIQLISVFTLTNFVVSCSVCHI